MPTILFQGDSITDAGRNYDAELPANLGMGIGYAFMAAAELLANRMVCLSSKLLTAFSRAMQALFNLYVIAAARPKPQSKKATTLQSVVSATPTKF